MSSKEKTREENLAYLQKHLTLHFVLMHFTDDQLIEFAQIYREANARANEVAKREAAKERVH